MNLIKKVFAPGEDLFVYNLFEKNFSWGFTFFMLLRTCLVFPYTEL